MTTLESAIFRRLMRTSVNSMVLTELIEPLHDALPAVEHAGPDARVSGLCIDSRCARPGDLFFAAAGARADGLRFAHEAVERGAVAVLADRPAELPPQTAFVGVSDVSAAKAILADRFFGQPSKRLDVVGITGTNGKTTTSFMLRSILTMDGRSAGLIGTLGAWIGQRHEPLPNTTPDAVELQRLLARMVDDNLSAAVMEVSSHALVQQRASQVDFDVGVFTNLTPDHLDYHGTMDAYAAAKGRLFEMLDSDGTAVLNASDPRSRQYRLGTRARVLQFALNAPADVRADVLRLDSDGTQFHVSAPEFGLDLRIASRLVGRHNVENALAAATAALALGLPPHAIATGLQGLTAVPGRLEPVSCGQDFRVLVDYAHTPDALEKVLDLLRPLTRGRLLVVFGCGGDRDRAKRPLMGRAVAEAADRLFVTSDNPRSEDPQAILDDIYTGIEPEGRARAVREPDRREAIRRACAEAHGGDIVLIAGKGHEAVQIMGDDALPFDDRQVAREVLWSL